MIYRVITVVAGILLVAVLFGLLWALCRWFLARHGVTENLSDRAMVLSTWTFAGVAVGLVFAVVGAFVLGPLAFYRTVRSHNVEVSDGAAIWWGFGIVAASLVMASGVFLTLLALVGAF
ncbi:MAG: hypothetical protein LAT63_01130 [Marinobacter sp.]|nr:hypothetical protein [Marinobacter sp.]